MPPLESIFESVENETLTLLSSSGWGWGSPNYSRCTVQLLTACTMERTPSC